MTKMLTRSSSRQAQTNEINLNPKHEDMFRRSCRQIRKPKSEVFLSDSDSTDSEDDRKLLRKNQNKTSERKSRRGTTKSQTVCSDSSDDENTTSKQPSNYSTPRKQKLQSSDNYSYQNGFASPPKQKKNNNGLPETPQHDRIEPNEEIQTPSRLIVKLKLTSPVEIQTLTTNSPTSSNRKQLFKESSEKNIFQSKQFCTVDDVKKSPNIYQAARRALHSTLPTNLPGRETEMTELRNFIKMHIVNKTSGSLYVSGPPGTGKTACLNIILQNDDICIDVRKVYVNCTAIKSPTAIYSKISKELNIKVAGKTERDYLAGVENYLRKQSKVILIVLDEIDQLECKNQSILYTIFEWPSKPDFRLILVGIANALDLTDRILPRLQARCELKPKLMHFAPYTKQQIVQILTARLKSVGVLDVFSPVALQMLAGKVAAVSGDVRRALDIGRRVIELVDQNKSGDVLKPIENLANELDGKPKTVELKQVMNVLNSVYGTSQNLTDETEDTFPLQQKIAICSLVLMLKKARNKDITIGKLHDVYKRVCSKRNIMSVDQAEFVGLCSLIETRGIIRVIGKKEPRLHKVSLEWDEEEVASALKDKQLMSMILQDETCLGKL